MKILIVSKDPTHPSTAGNRQAILAQAENLQRLGAEVHFLYVEELPLRKERRDEYLDALGRTLGYWGECFHHFRVSKWQKLRFNVLYRFRKACCSYVCGTDDDYPRALSAFAARLQERERFDLCIVNYYFMTRLFLDVSFPSTAVYTHDCFAYKNQVVGEKLLHITAHGEAVAMQRCDAVLAIQSEEADYFRIIAPRRRVYTVFSHYDYHPQQPCGNHDLLFLSGSNPFNVNGLNWFLKDILPAVRKRFPEARLKVGGAICGKRDVLVATEGVDYLGFVDDMASFYASADVAVNPVYQGTGLKIKTFEAVSYDKVTIVHPHSTKGIFKPQDAPVIVAEDASQWVAALERIWSGADAVLECKRRNAAYMAEMNSFIDGEYKRLLDDAVKK